MSNADFSALAAGWHDFYLLAGGAAATLIGLLFVGISINLDEFTADDGAAIRVLAEQAFANFIFVLLIALFVLIPGQGRPSLAIELAIVGVAAGARILRRASVFRRRGTRPFGGWRYIARRLGLSAVASVGAVGVAASLGNDPTTSLYWLVGVVIIFVTSAADSAWDLLIEVGRSRRRRTL